MSLGGLLRESVTVYNRADGALDTFGDPEDTFDVGTVVQAFVQPTNSSEDIIDRDTRLTTYRLVMPADAPIYADSEFEWENIRMRISGKPLPMNNHHGVHHVEVVAELIEG